MQPWVGQRLMVYGSVLRLLFEFKKHNRVPSLAHSFFGREDFLQFFQTIFGFVFCAWLLQNEPATNRELHITCSPTPILLWS